jgi:hypothetical protein
VHLPRLGLANLCDLQTCRGAARKLQRSFGGPASQPICNRHLASLGLLQHVCRTQTDQPHPGKPSTPEALDWQRLSSWSFLASDLMLICRMWLLPISRVLHLPNDYGLANNSSRLRLTNQSRSLRKCSFQRPMLSTMLYSFRSP